VREVAGELVELWQDFGGAESLSAQKRWLCERVVFLRHSMLVYEAAVIANEEPPMTAGEYSNFANVAQGHLKTLGLERAARRLPQPRELYRRACGSYEFGARMNRTERTDQLKAHREARRRQQLSRQFPRVWVHELGRHLWALSFFTASKRPGNAA
jgi:hypothetical protein